MVNIVENPKLDVFKSILVRGACFSEPFGFPLLKKTSFKPTKAIPFEKIRSINDYNQWVHFYIHDYKFQCIWNNPKQYINLLRKFSGVITPDFSLYWDMPLAMQIWNTYRNRAIGFWLQSNGINIIPNVRWGDERTFEFAFEGLEQGGTVAVSSYGCIQNKVQRKNFSMGLLKMIDKLNPDTIVNYSYAPDNIFGEINNKGIEVISIENHQATIHKLVGNE